MGTAAWYDAFDGWERPARYLVGASRRGRRFLANNHVLHHERIFPWFLGRLLHGAGVDPTRRPCARVRSTWFADFRGIHFICRAAGSGYLGYDACDRRVLFCRCVRCSRELA